jgi:hypothetical protein
MADESDRSILEIGFSEQALKDVDGTILQGHGRGQPVRSRRVVGQRINRQAFDIFGEPERPKGPVVRPTTPSVVDMTA